MPRYIDAEKLEQHFEYCISEAYNTNGVTEDFVTALRATRNQPTVDVVEVVRCKDCKYKVEEYENFLICGVFCNSYGLPFRISPNDYCSCG